MENQKVETFLTAMHSRTNQSCPTSDKTGSEYFQFKLFVWLGGTLFPFLTYNFRKRRN